MRSKTCCQKDNRGYRFHHNEKQRRNLYNYRYLQQVYPGRSKWRRYLTKVTRDNFLPGYGRMWASGTEGRKLDNWPIIGGLAAICCPIKVDLLQRTNC